MVNTKKEIGRPSKYQQLVSGLRLYLAKARTNPTLSLSISTIVKAIDVKKSTLYNYQHEPEVAELLNCIRALSKARKMATSQLDERIEAGASGTDTSVTEVRLGVVEVTTETASLELLARRAASAVQKAVWSMSRFTGRHRKHCYVSDLPRIVYDLDVTLADLNRIRQELNSLSDEWRQSSLSGCEVTNVETQLSFPNTYKEQF